MGDRGYIRMRLEENLQAKEMTGLSPEVSNEIEGTINDLRRGGQPLSNAIRDSFTSGQDILFGAGEYSPGTTERRRLLAHELMHTVQQNSPQFGPLLKYRRIQRLNIKTTGTSASWMEYSSP